MNEQTGELPITMQDLVATIGYWRAQFESADREIDVLEAQLQRRYAALYETRASAKRMLNIYEPELRAMAVNVNIATGSTQPHEAVGVRYIPKLVYDLPAAMAWALRHAPDLLVLDEVGFKKKALLLGAPAQEIKVPTAAIDKDLSRWTAVGAGV